MHIMIGFFFLVAAFGLFPKVALRIVGVGAALSLLIVVAVAVQNAG